MATQTQTLRRPVVQAERVHDYLYDHHYVVSSERDHARATFKAHTSSNRVKRVPNHATMFSELGHFPRMALRLDITDPVPKFVSRQWRGYQDQHREALIRYTTFNYDPSVKIPAQSFGDAQVSGQNRYKYFRRPYIPFMQQVPPDVLLASNRQDPMGSGNADQALIDRPPTPSHKTMETQTDYRDSEAQTDPYTPEYVVRPGSQPELLTLATLSYGRGLPAGLAEVEMIERARAKRAWEATLPPLNDRDQLDKRRRMMDDMERKEWALRESEIEKLQEARLTVLKKLLRQREEHHQELNTKRLDRLWAKKQQEKEDKVKKIRNEHIKTIRKLSEKRRRVEGNLERRDVVGEYADHSSQVYAPMTRIGVFLDRGSEQFVVKSRYLDTYQGLLELEQSLPVFVTAPRIMAPKPKTGTKSGFVKRRYRRERELAEIHQVIKENKAKAEEPPKPLKFLQKIEKPIPRPPTPSVEVPSQDEEERELAIIALQQVIRGRAIQNMMFEGKEKRIELIQELRSTHALQENEQAVKKQERQATLALQRQRRLHEHKESFVDEALASMEGESLGDMLDFLGKELIRVQEERKIHAFSMLAERQRRIREAEESGRRQLEERRRREQDETFKQLVSVHQDTVDTYLEDIILGSIDRTADEQARAEIQKQAETINDVAYELEESRTALQSEEIVSELVHEFLLPEVQKMHVREKVKLSQRKYLSAAHHEIFSNGEGVIDMYPKAGVSGDEKPSEQKFAAASAPVEAPAAAASPVQAASPVPQEPAKSPTPSTPAQSPVPISSPAPPEACSHTPVPSSRPSSVASKGSRRGSAASKKASDSKPGSPDLMVTGTASPQPASKPATPSGSRPPSGRKSANGEAKAASPAPGSRPASAQSKTGSQPGSRRGSGASQAKPET